MITISKPTSSELVNAARGLKSGEAVYVLGDDSLVDRDDYQPPGSCCITTHEAMQGEDCNLDAAEIDRRIADFRKGMLFADRH